MRNTWIILKREYLERVRTRSFLVLTLLLPAIMTVLMSLPAKLAMMGEKQQHIVIVTSNPQFGEAVRHRLHTLTSHIRHQRQSNGTGLPRWKRIDANTQ